MQYKVSIGKEWFTLTRIYKTGETVELPEHEGTPFVGSVFDAPEPVAVAPVETATAEPVTEATPEDKPKHKRSK